MALEEKPLYLRGGSIPKIEPCLDMLEFANSKIYLFTFKTRKPVISPRFFLLEQTLDHLAISFIL